ncbi:MAG: hypothetical protein Q4A34_03355 [Candidatus Saccharibacteria bacterium]|nr:hypothetical protein [Candidatus Saccharibacteria bacterium]
MEGTSYTPDYYPEDWIFDDTFIDRGAVRYKLDDSLAEHAKDRAEWNAKMQELQKKGEQERLLRREFLEKSGAKATPAHLYALWLYTYLRQRGAILRTIATIPMTGEV